MLTWFEFGSQYGGANWSVTKNRVLLHISWDIEPHTMGDIGGGLTCTDRGVYHMMCKDNTISRVNMYYSADATKTIIMPTYIVLSYSDIIDTW